MVAGWLSEKLALCFYLAKKIALSTPIVGAVPDLYLRFARALTDKDVVISLNWDCLLEHALKQSGREFTYTFEEGKIKIAKLHGSINWRLDAPSDLEKPVNTLDWRRMDFGGGRAIEDLWATDQLANPLAWDGYNPLRELQPFLVLPGYGKAFEARQNASLWYRPEVYFFLSLSVYIIGLSPCDDDHFLRSFFLNALPAADRPHTIINPDGAARRSFDLTLKDGMNSFIEERFSIAHMDLIEADV